MPSRWCSITSRERWPWPTTAIWSMRRSFAGSWNIHGAIFQTTIDSEVIAYHIARRACTSKIRGGGGGAELCKKIKGAYSLVIMSPQKADRRAGIPSDSGRCVSAKRDNAYILASETCALDTLGAEFVRDVEPGEIVTITPETGIHV